jgi:hypothetical protein
MSTSLLLRPVETDDLADLAPLDAAYAARYGVDPLVGAAALSFFARTGHAFVAQAAGGTAAGPPGGTAGGPAGSPVGAVAGAAGERPRPVGMALAQAVWDGARPTVWLVRLIGEAPARRALADAVVKSAYDAAVYTLVADVPGDDADLADLMADAGWRERPIRRFERTLGSGALRRGP